jgi:hypothetical protein
VRLTKKWRDLGVWYDGEELAALREMAALARIFRDIAVSRASTKKLSRTGGQNSGDARYAALMKQYGNEALCLAKKIRAEDPGIVQMDLANKIEFHGRVKNLRPSMLPQLIRRWERDGVLPKRKK